MSPTSSSASVATRVGSGTRSPSVTLSSTRFHGTRRGSWKATATGSATAIDPDTSRSSPASARSRVDLPDPLRPIIATNSPALMSRLSPSSTTRSPNRLVRSRTEAAT